MLYILCLVPISDWMMKKKSEKLTKKIFCMCIFDKCNTNTQNKIFINIYFKYFKTTSKVIGAKRYSAIVIRLWIKNQHTRQVWGLGRYLKPH
jgi:hypothetical protein